MKTIIVMMIYYALGKDGATHAAIPGFDTIDACYKAKDLVMQDYLRGISYFGYSAGAVAPPYVSCLALPAGPVTPR